MNKPNFTPGPWKYHAPTNTDQRLFIEHPDGTGRIIAGMSQGFCFNKKCIPIEEREANARLIAAAPEMFEALHDALVYITDCIDCSEDNKLIARAKKDEANIRAILAKVRGE